MIRMKVIKPVTPFNPGIFRQTMHAQALAVAAGINKDFNATTRTWKHDVDFKTVVQTPPGEVSVSVSTKDKIYGYVDRGTRKHRIRPKKKGGLLAFQKKYKAKTTPHVIGSHAGGPTGEDVFAKGVVHPGTDPRYFARDIQAKWQPRLAKEMEAAIAKAARQSGHSA